MADNDLEKRAASMGVLTSYVDHAGRRCEVPNETVERILQAMSPSSTAVSQARRMDSEPCYLPQRLFTWGWAVQLYAARSSASWGIGDLADLRAIAGWAADQGAGMLMINPLHASIPVPEQSASPYYPSSRVYRNPLYLRIEEIPGASDAAIEDLASRAKSLNDTRLIDRDAVFALKMEALERIWEAGTSEHFEGSLDEEDTLADYSVFCIAAEQFGVNKAKWPRELADREPAAIATLRYEAEDRVRFHSWIQQLLDRQLLAASEQVPIVGDLAIGVDPRGADAWMWKDAFVDSVSIGAPPDEFNTQGQNWGLPPMDPRRLREISYEPFVQTVRSAFRHAGGLRIDHVMGLFRLFWIPDGMEPIDGTYVRYEEEELLAIVATESRRAKAIVVGEDLGTVEPSVRTEMARAKMLSQKVLWFEEEDPKHWPPLSIASVTTHDLPTIAGLLSGRDLQLQKQIGMSPNERSVEGLTDRLSGIVGRQAAAIDEDVILAIHEHISNAASATVFAGLEDALMVQERPNLPGSNRQENWSLALPLPLEELFDLELPAKIAAVLKGRNRPDRQD